MKRKNTHNNCCTQYYKYYIVNFCLVIFALMAIIIIFYPVSVDIKTGRWAKRELDLYNASEQQRNDLLREYDNNKKLDYALKCVTNTKLRYNSILYGNQQRGAYHARILGLLNNKMFSLVIKRKLTEFISEYAKCEHNILSYNDRLWDLPCPIPAFIWSLLLLEGDNGYYWLRQELSKYPGLSATNTILDFAHTICWVVDNDTYNELVHDDSITTLYFDSNWIGRYISRLQKDGFDVSKRNLLETLKQLASHRDELYDSLYESWRAKSAAMVLRAMTADKQYQVIYLKP